MGGPFSYPPQPFPLSLASCSAPLLASSLHPCCPQAQRQLLHAELKLVLQQKGKRKQEPGAQVTPSSAMEARSQSAEVGTHTSCQRDSWSLGWGHRLGWQGDTSWLLCLSLPICEMEIVIRVYLMGHCERKKLTYVKCLAQCLVQSKIQSS